MVIKLKNVSKDESETFVICYGLACMMLLIERLMMLLVT